MATINLGRDVEVSVINDGYGGDKGLYEVAIIHHGQLWLNNPVVESFMDGGDGTVVGWLTFENVLQFIEHVLNSSLLSCAVCR